MYGLDPEVINNLRDIFSKFKQISSVILYGSRAKGNYQKGSDIDLTLLGEGLTLSVVYKVNSKIEDLNLPYEFDISIHKNIDNQKLKDHINRVGKIFYQKKTALPKGWEMKKLGDVCEILNGGTPKTGNVEFWGGNVKWITPKDMGKLISKYVDETPRKITNLGLQKSSAKIIPINSIILSTRAPIGHLAINTSEMATNQGCRGIIPSIAIDTHYLYYFLSKSVELLNDLGTGATFRELSKKALSSITIPLPPLPEQKRILAILDKAFAAIDKAKANAEQNLINTKELFESYLQGVFENKGEGWDEKKVNEIGNTQTGTTPKTAEKENYGDFIPFIKPADVDFSGVGDIRYDNKGLSVIGLRKGRKMESGSILMVCIGATIGKVGFTEQVVSCNQQINSLTVEKEFKPKFIYYAMTSKEFQDKVYSEGKGAQATLPIINKTKWENLTILFPKSKIDQQTIVKKLDALSAETKKLETIYQEKIEDLEELKKSVLQKAFNGELTK